MVLYMKRVVIKFGTSSLTDGTQKLSRRTMLSLVQQIVALHNKGLELILISSGAVATGRDLFQSANGDRSSASKQLLASVGQVKLMQVWSELFALFELQIGQILLTKDDFSDQRIALIRETLGMLLEHRVIPIINENDTMSTKEFCVGDNDNLAALVAHAV